MEENAIFDFSGLKDLLRQKGYTVGKAEPWRSINSEEVNLREGNLEFKSDGIFLTDNDGIKRQVFLYKRHYHLAKYGLPRFHICKCKTIDSFLRGNNVPEYRRANTKTVKVLDWDDNDKEKEVSNLPLCKYCAAIIYNGKDYLMNSSDFSEILRKAADANELAPKKVEVGRNGYTKDWQAISTKFREQKNYTCEKCGIQVSPFESEFMHVHHKNGDKTDNSPSNLQCLCIKCHSEINKMHIKNFSTRNQQLLLRLFSEKYDKDK